MNALNAAPDGPIGSRRGLSVSLLGEMVVEVDGSEVALNAARQRAVLARLALRPGEPISADRLLEDIWGAERPTSGVRAVAYQISKLRSLLEPGRDGEGSLITTTAAGYALAIGPEEVDALRFDRLVDDARRLVVADPEAALGEAASALRLWRGRPLADLGDEPFVEAEVRRLDQRRLAARRTQLEALVTLGRHAEATAEVEPMVDDHPLEEGLVGLLMQSLHGAGRTADALRAFGELRVRLGSELGIEPSADLRALEAELLAGGPGPTRGPAQLEPLDLAGPATIPVPVTSLVGRDDELVGIVELMTMARVVTLCGFGGLGKTRLAQEVAATEPDRCDDEVWYVDLTSVAEEAALGDTFAAAGGIAVVPDRDPVVHLVEALIDRRVLVVVDNCEHLLEPVADLVARIAGSAPGVRVLATSRVRLGIAGEAVWPVKRLPAGFDLALFADRARLARPGFSIDRSNRSEVEEICARLDGIPLAIEMAAARLSVMSVGQIAGHLDGLEILTGPDPDADDEQRSLEAVMAWSLGLLDDGDQRLFRRLAVCAGGFTLEAAVGIGGGPGSSPVDVLDRLGRLVDASLVVFDDAPGLARYRMLEPVRYYAAGLLGAAERADVGRAHAEFYASVAEVLYDLFTGDVSGEDVAVGRTVGDAELANLRAAMTWAFRNGAVPVGIAIILGSRVYFWSQMMHRETMRWALTGIELADGDPPTDEVLECAGLALVEAFNTGDREALAVAAARVERGLDETDDPVVRARLLNALATAIHDADPHRAVQSHREALELLDGPSTIAMAVLNNRIETSWTDGRIEEVDAMAERVAELKEAAIGPAAMVSKIEVGLAARCGRWDDVIVLADGAGPLEGSVASAVDTMRAEALGALGRYDAAINVLDRLGLEAEHSHHARSANLVRATVDIARGRPHDAVELLLGMADGLAGESKPGAECYLGSLLGCAATAAGSPEIGAVWLGHAAAVRSWVGTALRPSDRPLVDAAVARCREELGDERFDELAAEGAATGFEQLPRPAVVGDTT